jgi:hypothetical protein
LALGVGNYLAPPLGNCLALDGPRVGNYLALDNPVYSLITGYYNEVQASLKGAPWSVCVGYGAQGIANVENTVLAPYLAGRAMTWAGGWIAGRTAGGMNDLMAQAAARYPNKASLPAEWHHATPLYVGGPSNGPQYLLPAPYHQLITNAWREAVPYGTGGSVTAKEVEAIASGIYSRYPISGFPVR